MSSNTAKYRLENPEYREKEREKERIAYNQKWKEDEAYCQKKQERALAFYQKKKELQQSKAISAN